MSSSKYLTRFLLGSLFLAGLSITTALLQVSQQAKADGIAPECILFPLPGVTCKDLSPPNVEPIWDPVFGTGNCPDTYTPKPFIGRTGKVAFYNGNLDIPVTIVLYHPNTQSIYGRYVVEGGRNQIIGGFFVGDDWGMCIEEGNSHLGIFNVGKISEYNPNYQGSPLFMIQNDIWKRREGR